MSNTFNYRHLYYFWVVAKEGGIAKAAARLGMAVQTVGAQVRALERDLGCALLQPAGRGVALTHAGITAMQQADAIFALGEELPALVRNAVSHPTVRLAVGISDGLPKMVVQKLLAAVSHTPHLRLICHEDEFDRLLGDLALHKLDVVLSDRPAPPSRTLRLESHLLGKSQVNWYADRRLGLPGAAGADGLVNALSRMPVLMPTAHTALRIQLEQWFERQGIHPRIAGEFEDSALLTTFGLSGMGAFPSVALIHDSVVAHAGMQLLGSCDDLYDHFYAIGTQHKVQHPLVVKMLQDTAHTLAPEPGSPMESS